MREQAADRASAIVAKAIGSVGEIGTLPEVAVRVIEVVEAPDSTASQLHEVMKHDPTLTTRVLKVVNSAFYGLPGQVADVKRAIILLGQYEVRNIAVSTSVGQMFTGPKIPNLFDAKDLWRHSLAVALAARKVPDPKDKSPSRDEMFLAGLLHDLGLIVERQLFQKELAEVCRRAHAGEEDFLALEREIIGATHEDFGHALARKWRLPQNLRAGISGHHYPETLPEESQQLARILRCVDSFCCQEGFGFDLEARNQKLTPELLAAAGISADLLQEMRDGLEDEIQEAESILGAN